MKVQRDGRSFTVDLTVDGEGVVSHVGAALIAAALEIGRRYRFQGRPRSLLSASCAARPGFPGAIINFAKGSFSFAYGRRLTTTLTRDHQVRQ
jgi:hypothetical protein